MVRFLLLAALSVGIVISPGGSVLGGDTWTVTISVDPGAPGSAGSGPGHSWIVITDPKGNTTTYGTWDGSNGSTRGVNKNHESKLGMTPKVSRPASPTAAQLAELNKFIQQQIERGEKAWGPYKNCTDFAAKAWKIATGEDIAGLPIPAIQGRTIERLNSADGKSPSQAVPSAASGGVESHPVAASLLASNAVAAPRRRWSVDLDDVLPTSALKGKTAIPVIPSLTMRYGNADAARGVDYRVRHPAGTTTVAAAIVTRTLKRTYSHDFHVCARYHGRVLRGGYLVPMLESAAATSPDKAPKVWCCLMQNPQTNAIEQGFQFCAFVNESTRKCIVDSRWLADSYARFWDGDEQEFDYVLNYQIYAASRDDARALLREAVRKLQKTWAVSFESASVQRPLATMIESACLDGGTVKLSVWHWLDEPRLAFLYGTQRLSERGRDIRYEHWRVVRPGRNVISIAVGPTHNTVTHIQVDGFVDKVYISRDNPGRPLRRLAEPHDRSSKLVAAPPAQFAISWPPGGAKVLVEQDLTNAAQDYRLVLHGTVPARSDDFRIDVQVFTDKWYPQRPAVVRDGLWAARVALGGSGRFNDHRIRVMLRNTNGRVVSQTSARNLIRVRPGRESTRSGD